MTYISNLSSDLVKLGSIINASTTSTTEVSLGTISIPAGKLTVNDIVICIIVAKNNNASGSVSTVLRVVESGVNKDSDIRTSDVNVVWSEHTTITQWGSDAVGGRVIMNRTINNGGTISANVRDASSAANNWLDDAWDFVLRGNVNTAGTGYWHCWLYAVRG